MRPALLALALAALSAPALAAPVAHTCVFDLSP